MTKKSSERKKIEKKIKTNMLIINKRIRRIHSETKFAGGSEKFITTQKEIFYQLTGQKAPSKNPYKQLNTGNVSHMSNKSLQRILTQQNLFLNSKKSTLKGRNEINKKALKTLNSRSPGRNMTMKQYKKFTEILNSEAYEKIKADKDFYRPQELMDEVQDNLNMKKFEQFIDMIITDPNYSNMSPDEVAERLKVWNKVDKKTYDNYDFSSKTYTSEELAKAFNS